MADLHSGYITIRLSERFLPLLEQGKDLRVLARDAGALELAAVLDQYSNCAIEPLVSSVAPGRLRELEKAARERGRANLPSLASYWRIDARKIEDVLTLLERLTKAAGVERAYRELRYLDPAVNPANDPFSNLQHHLDAAPIGIDARWAWTQRNGAGESVAFVDLEQGWYLRHEDFPSIFALPGVRQDSNPGHERHGTAVVGIVAGADNDKGIVGVAPHAAQVSVASHFRASDATEGLVAETITSVLDSGHITEGDVLLLEVLVGDNLPAELDEPIFIAIANAIALGVIVVEAAGNGDVDLDTHPELDTKSRDTFKDSGAIIVGAGMSALDATGAGHERWLLTPPPPPPISRPASNYGSRVDCYAYGENVVTTGPTPNPACALGAGTTPTTQYRCDFGGTSAAAPIVAGAAVVLQGMHRATKGGSLSPDQMRQVFRTVGTPQGLVTPGHIGLMPDLKAAALALSLAIPPPSAPKNVRIVR